MQVRPIGESVLYLDMIFYLLRGTCLILTTSMDCLLIRNLNILEKYKAMCRDGGPRRRDDEESMSESKSEDEKDE